MARRKSEALRLCPYCKVTWFQSPKVGLPCPKCAAPPVSYGGGKAKLVFKR
jgi:ribosomal protein S27E